MDNSIIRIDFTEKKGRGLFASKNFNKGETIFEEEPFVSSQFAWNEDYKYQACELCLRPLETAIENVKRLTMMEITSLPYPELCCVNKNFHVCCPLCGIKYCSVDCRELAWNKYHNTLCIQTPEKNKTHPLEVLKETWKKMHYPPETTTVMLFVKIFAMIHQAQDKDSVKKMLKQFCHHIVNKNENMSHKLVGLKFSEQVETLRQLVISAVPTQDVPEWITPDGFMLLIALVGLNGQGIGTSSFAEWVKNISKLEIPDAERTSIDNYIQKIYGSFDKTVGDFLNNEGSGIYSLQSTINHSCRPNAEITFPNSNFKLAVKATQNISMNDEICISYLDECTLERSRHSRQKILQENYLFTCTCEKCEEEILEMSETSSDDTEQMNED